MPIYDRRAETLSTAEAAGYMGVTRQTVLNWVRQGKLRGQRRGLGALSSVFFDRRDIERLVTPKAQPTGRRIWTGRLERRHGPCRMSDAEVLVPCIGYCSS